MEAAFLNILNMSVTASYVIIAVVLIRLLLIKAPKKCTYLLWTVVGFRLWCPVSFQSVFSIFGLKLFDMTTAQKMGGSEGKMLQYVPDNIGIMARPQVTLGIPTANTIITDSLPAGTPVASINPMQVWLGVSTVLWCVGIVILLCYSIFTYVKIYRSMEKAILLEGNVYESDRISSPFVLGFIQPKIYIPFGLDKNTMGYVLTHERYHIKRFDHMVKPMAFLLLTLHWFNPLCWVAFILMSRDMEMSCDEAVLTGEENIRKAYSLSLLSFASNRRLPAPNPLAFGETGVKRRIKNTLKWKKPKMWITVIAIAFSIIVVVACAANPRSKKLFDFKDKKMEIATTIDLRTSSKPLVLELSEVQMEELVSRLNSISNTKKSEEYAGFTRLYYIHGELEDGTKIEINMYEDKGEKLDILWGKKRYVIRDQEFISYVSNIFSRKDRVLATKESGDTYADDTYIEGTYVSSTCLYMNPLSSFYPFDGDSGYKYIIEKDGFTIINKSDNVEMFSAQSIEWNWQPFPYTEEEWKALFIPGAYALYISNYKNCQYVELSRKYRLLRMDEELWLLDINENPQMGVYLWSIYTLVQKEIG